MGDSLKPIIAVVGAGSCTTEIYRLAEEAGRLLAQRGFSVICGGLGGVMEVCLQRRKKCRGSDDWNSAGG